MRNERNVRNAIEAAIVNDMIAFIPGLCPFDDIVMWMLFPALLVWLKRRYKWCRKQCDCDCHSKKSVPPNYVPDPRGRWEDQERGLDKDYAQEKD